MQSNFSPLCYCHLGSMKIFQYLYLCCVVWLQIQRLSGVDSDFAPFVQHAGVPSVDVYYGRGMPLTLQNLLALLLGSSWVEQILHLRFCVIEVFHFLTSLSN